MFTQNGEDICAYHDLYQILMTKLIRANVIEKPMRQDQLEQISEDVNTWIQQVEVKLLYLVNFKLDLSTGHDILGLILKKSDQNYPHFDNIMSCVNRRCQVKLFSLGQNSLPHTIEAVTNCRQSLLYMSCLKNECDRREWQDFYADLVQMLKDENIFYEQEIEAITKISSEDDQDLD